MNSAEGTTDQRRTGDHLANERTYLAWLRTGIGVIVFGFASGRFALALQQIGDIGGTKVKTTGMSLDMGIASMVLGVGLIFVGMQRYHANRLRINEGTFRPATTLATAIGVLIMIFGLTLSVYLLLTHNALMH
ncbi:MAG: DUF202 domain-containing protein [Terriglobales bacterium]